MANLVNWWSVALLGFLLNVSLTYSLELNGCVGGEVKTLSETDDFHVDITVTDEKLQSCKGHVFHEWTFIRDEASTSNRKWELVWTVEQFDVPLDCTRNNLTGKEFIHNHKRDVCEHLKEHSELPFVITTTSDKFVVKLNLQDAANISFTAITTHLCSDTYNLTDDTAIFINSPRFPAYYQESVVCIYAFHTPADKDLDINCNKFDVGESYGGRWAKRCTDNFVISRTTTGVLATFCGKSLEGKSKQLVTSNGAGNVIFRSHNCEQNAKGCQKADAESNTDHEDYIIPHIGFNCSVKLINKK